MTHSRSRRWWHYGLSYGVSVLFVIVLVYHLNWAEVLTQMATTPWYLVLLALVALGGSYGVRILRWLFMLRALTPTIRYFETATVFISSMAFNNILPLRAGDFLRLFAVRQQAALPPARIMGTLVLERLLDLLVILGFFYGTLLIVESESIPNYWLEGVQWLLAICLIVLIALFVFAPFFSRFLLRIERIEWVQHFWLTRKIIEQGRHFLQAILLIRSLRRLLFLLILSLVAWSIESTVFVAAALAVDYQGSWVGPYFAFALGTLATTLPSSPGYVGTFDYFTAMGLRAFGVSMAGATAFALLAHLFLWLPVTLVGLGCYWARGRLKEAKND